MQTYTNDLIENCVGDLGKIRDTCRAGTQVHIAVLFHFTVMGQCIKNLRTQESFLLCASAKLRVEFEALRWIRNNLMHGKSVNKSGSMLRYYTNDLMTPD
ncbi:MAG: hypothetical protein M3R00_06715 [Pseudomonadota bacterium]|nr:hypothetical protein [Pseudomonadota bacterium]